ncbi:DgyrCDS8471 [Dimorphilus gyrociliatus]|uniref:DgyrCDS8471 n=1 Tax=Dimorphilus gyrociliatus TaxID=2664684 RepID=A0A7I8VU84_9ANNE|nr:DgyrCDS8471 [Dimorphilus gyrociliatus]
MDRVRIKIVDCFLSSIVFFPMTVIYWRGSWDLLDIYVLPRYSKIIRFGSMYIFGLFGIAAYFSQPLLERQLRNINGTLRGMLCRFYMYAYSWMNMSVWRGGWGVLSEAEGDNWKRSAIVLSVSYFLLVLMRTSRTSMWPPFTVNLDFRPDLLRPTTLMNRMPRKNDLFPYLLDAFLSHVIVFGLAVSVWKNAWDLMDVFIFPNQPRISDLFCVVAGYFISTSLFVFQTKLARVSASMDGRQRWRLIYEDCVYVFALIALLLLYRGMWNLCSKYILPESSVGALLCHLFGTVSLFSMQIFSTVGSPGVGRDGYETNGTALFPIRYMSTFFKEVSEGLHAAQNVLLNEITV